MTLLICENSDNNYEITNYELVCIYVRMCMHAYMNVDMYVYSILYVFGRRKMRILNNASYKIVKMTKTPETL